MASDVKIVLQYNTLPVFQTQQLLLLLQLLLCTFLTARLLQAIHPSSSADVSI